MTADEVLWLSARPLPWRPSSFRSRIQYSSSDGVLSPSVLERNVKGLRRTSRASCKYRCIRSGVALPHCRIVILLSHLFHYLIIALSPLSFHYRIVSCCLSKVLTKYRESIRPSTLSSKSRTTTPSFKAQTTTPNSTIFGSSNNSDDGEEDDGSSSDQGTVVIETAKWAKEQRKRVSSRQNRKDSTSPTAMR